MQVHSPLNETTPELNRFEWHVRDVTNSYYPSFVSAIVFHVEDSMHLDLAISFWYIPFVELSFINEHLVFR